MPTQRIHATAIVNHWNCFRNPWHHIVGI